MVRRAGHLRRCRFRAGGNDSNTKIIEEFRANEGRVGGPWACERVSPLGYFSQGGGRFAIVASNGGSPAHPDWYYNLKGHPRITVEVGTQTFTVLAEELDHAALAVAAPISEATAPGVLPAAGGMLLAWSGRRCR